MRSSYLRSAAADSMWDNRWIPARGCQRRISVVCEIILYDLLWSRHRWYHITVLIIYDIAKIFMKPELRSMCQLFATSFFLMVALVMSAHKICMCKFLTVLSSKHYSIAMYFDNRGLRFIDATYLLVVNLWSASRTDIWSAIESVGRESRNNIVLFRQWCKPSRDITVDFFLACVTSFTIKSNTCSWKVIT